MALGTNHVTLTSAATFVPEIWSDEVIAAYTKSKVMANLVRKMPMKGKKGDTIHIPKPVRGNASVKAAETQVTLIANVESEVVVTVDRHFEYSRLIEDIVGVQALNSLRRFYTQDAGEALAIRVDTDLLALGTALGNGTLADATLAASWQHNRAFTFSATGLTVYDGDVAATGEDFTDAGFRKAIQTLDDADVPMSERYFVIPPLLRNVLMGTARYTEQAFVGENGSANTIRNGRVGNLYGIEVYISTNLPTITELTGTARPALLFNREAFVLAEQMGVRTQTQYKQEWLADLMTADMLYGRKTVRPENGVALIVNNA